MKQFIRHSKWDMLLCAIMIFAASTTVFSGFHVPREQVSMYWFTALLSVAAAILLTMASYQKRTIIIGILAVIAILAAMTAGSAASGQNAFRDAESNPCLRYFLWVLVSLVVFLLSRFRTGSWILFGAGTLTLCLIQFLYESRHIVCMILFLAACGAMMMYREYMTNVLHSRTKTAVPGRSVLYSTLLCLMAVAVGTGIFYGVVNPLHPPKKNLQLITKVMSLEVLEKIGVATEKTIRDPNLSTSRTGDEQTTTTQKSRHKDDRIKADSSRARSQDAQHGESPNQRSDQKGSLSGIRYDHEIPFWLIVLIMVICVMAAAVGIKLYLRHRWIRELIRQEDREKVKRGYLFCLKKFRQMGLKRSPGETPLEYAERTEPKLWPFREDHTGFSQLSRMFSAVAYGDVRPEETQIKELDLFFRSFYRNTRLYLGKFRYILKFFIL